jgi:membrane-associated phospholipid phosphatase
MVITHDRDLDLIAWDQRLFGFQASVALQKIVTPSLTAWMEFAYFFHLPNIPIVACFLYIWRPRERFREMMCGVLVVTALGLMGYLLVPGVGPMYALRSQFTVPLDQPFTILSQQAEFVDFARVQRDVFPSLHVGISFIVWLYAWRNSKRLFWILSPLILSLWLSTVYLRYHYLVDVVAGLILAPLCFCFSNWMFKRIGIISVPVWLPEKWAERVRRSRSQPTPGSVNTNGTAQGKHE